MKNFKSLQVSIDFSTVLNNFANPLKCIFIKFSLNFRENFDKILKNFQKIAKFTCKFSKNYKILIDF